MAVKSGYVTIIGKPNAGKSTLLNAFLGEKLSITTNKPQTTRKRITGILSTEEYQIIFLDTPGILKPGYLLQEKMLDFVWQSVKDADVLLFILDIQADPEARHMLEDENVQKILNSSGKNKILVLNKVDLSTEPKIKTLMTSLEEKKLFTNIFPVSAMLNYNTDNVLAKILEYMPEHPKYYPNDDISDAPERFFVSEIIREQILEQFQDEIPYSVEVVIEDFREREARKDFIQVAIIVEKESQKPILIGKKGAAIKKLGETSRAAIESFLQRPVFLDMRVKVKNKWRSDPNSLKSFGYSFDADEEE